MSRLPREAGLLTTLQGAAWSHERWSYVCLIRILSGDDVVDALSVLVAAAFYAVPLICVHGPLLSGPLVRLTTSPLRGGPSPKAPSCFSRI
jgi:hypothetical protein